MKAIQATRDNRRIKFINLPDTVSGLTNRLTELEISIKYTGDANGRKAIVLDNVIIPAIVEAINKQKG